MFNIKEFLIENKITTVSRIDEGVSSRNKSIMGRMHKSIDSIVQLGHDVDDIMLSLYKGEESFRLLNSRLQSLDAHAKFLVKMGQNLKDEE